jgi:hypothetical protein
VDAKFSADSKQSRLERRRGQAQVGHTGNLGERELEKVVKHDKNKISVREALKAIAPSLREPRKFLALLGRQCRHQMLLHEGNGWQLLRASALTSIGRKSPRLNSMRKVCPLLSAGMWILQNTPVCLEKNRFRILHSNQRSALDSQTAASLQVLADRLFGIGNRQWCGRGNDGQSVPKGLGSPFTRKSSSWTSRMFLLPNVLYLFHRSNSLSICRVRPGAWCGFRVSVAPRIAVNAARYATTESLL